MEKRVEVKTDLTAEVLYERYRRVKDPMERTHWHMKEEKSPQEAARVFCYTAGRVRTMVRRSDGYKLTLHSFTPAPVSIGGRVLWILLKRSSYESKNMF